MAMPGSRTSPDLTAARFLLKPGRKYEEAVKAFLELRAKTLVPMHYGTFRLSFEPMHEPPERLLASARAHGIEEKILIMTEGKPVVL